VKERPILFSAPMVRAILDGRKIQTRRVLKPGKFVLPSGDDDWSYNGFALVRDHDGGTSFHPLPFCPYGEPGDRLWVKEAFRLRADQDHKPPSQDYLKSGAWHEATGNGETPSGCGGGIGRLRSSIHMPRWASRIDLEITDVRVQRLQDITIADAMAEGIPQTAGEAHAAGLYDMTKEPGHEWDNRTSVENYARLWDQINGAGSWEANPWVWALTFRRVRR